MSETPDPELDNAPAVVPSSPPLPDARSLEARLNALSPPEGADEATWHELYQAVLRIVRESV